ncbi:hypothetical protein QOT17_021428 [Balamuthia mandrillaris]
MASRTAVLALLAMALASVALVGAQWTADCSQGDCLFVNNMGQENLSYYTDPLMDDYSDGIVDWGANWYSTPFNASWNILPVRWNTTVTPDDFTVPAGQKWTLTSITFIGTEDPTYDLQVNRKMYWYFWNNVQRLQNGTWYNQPDEVDQPFWYARCNAAGNNPNLVANSTRFFRRGTLCYAYTCTFEEPLVIDNTNSTEDRIVWHAWIKHHMWSLVTLYREAYWQHTTKPLYLTNPPMNGNHMVAWVGGNTTGIRSFPWTYYSTADLTLYDKWFSWAPYEFFGELIPGPDRGFQTDWPILIRGSAETA